MSSAVTTPHAARVSVLFKHSLVAVKAENTYYVEDNTDAIFDDLPGFAAQVQAAVVSALVPQAYSAQVFTGVNVEDIRTHPFAGYELLATPTAGTKGTTTTVLPTSAALAVKRLTSTPGRAGRGRLYWPLWDTRDVATTDDVGATRATSIVTALAAFQTAVEGGTHPVLMGVVSTRLNGAPRAFGEFTQITSWGVSDTFVDSQRRRLVGRGS